MTTRTEQKGFLLGNTSTIAYTECKQQYPDEDHLGEHLRYGRRQHHVILLQAEDGITYILSRLSPDSPHSPTLLVPGQRWHSLRVDLTPPLKRCDTARRQLLIDALVFKGAEASSEARATCYAPARLDYQFTGMTSDWRVSEHLCRIISPCVAADFVA